MTQERKASFEELTDRVYYYLHRAAVNRAERLAREAAEREAHNRETA